LKIGEVSVGKSRRTTDREKRGEAEREREREREREAAKKPHE